MARKNIIVTGAGGVLGDAVAKVARERGARVIAIDKAGLIPGRFGDGDIVMGGIDLTDFDAISNALSAARDQAGGIDVLLNIAGGFRWQTLEGGDPNGWDALFRMNLLTAVATSRAALPHLLASPRASIVNVGASSAIKAAAGMGAYAASKAGVAKLTESLAEELRGRVRVNAVLPSIIDTPTNRADMPDANFKTWVAPTDLAAVILFLAGDDSAAMTGALVPVVGAA